MKRNFNKSLITALLLCITGLIYAQEIKDQVTVKITRKVNGKSVSFEKTYDSEEALQADQELKEFVGNDSKMNFFGEEDSQVFTWSDDMAQNFSFQLEGDSMPHFQFFGNDDSIMKSFEIDMKDFEDQMKVFHLKLAENMKEMNTGQAFMFSFPNDSSFNWQRNDSSEEGMKKHFQFLTRNEEIETTNSHAHIFVTEDVKEFGKKAEVKKSRELKINDLTFETGRLLKVSFTAPENGELTVKLTNHNGKEVYSRYFENHQGEFSEAMDLSQQKPGNYLLEINLNGKRLTRKITIH